MGNDGRIRRNDYAGDNLGSLLAKDCWDSPRAGTRAHRHGFRVEPGSQTT